MSEKVNNEQWSVFTVHCSITNTNRFSKNNNFALCRWMRETGNNHKRRPLGRDTKARKSRLLFRHHAATANNRPAARQRAVPGADRLLGVFFAEPYGCDGLGFREERHAVLTQGMKIAKER